MTVVPRELGEIDPGREESQGSRIRRERRQEIQEPLFIIGSNRPDVDRQAVPKRNVGFAVGGIGDGHGRPPF
jgi:hypothetical protein